MFCLICHVGIWLSYYRTQQLRLFRKSLPTTYVMKNGLCLGQKHRFVLNWNTFMPGGRWNSESRRCELLIRNSWGSGCGAFISIWVHAKCEKTRNIRARTCKKGNQAKETQIPRWLRVTNVVQIRRRQIGCRPKKGQTIGDKTEKEAPPVKTHLFYEFYSAGWSSPSF